MIDIVKWIYSNLVLLINKLRLLPKKLKIYGEVMDKTNEYFNNHEEKLPLAAAENANWAIEKICKLRSRMLRQGRYEDNNYLVDIADTVASSYAAISQQLIILDKNKYQEKDEPD